MNPLIKITIEGRPLSVEMTADEFRIMNSILEWLRSNDEGKFTIQRSEGRVKFDIDRWNRFAPFRSLSDEESAENGGGLLKSSV
jgi:hypothetical protein